MKVTIKFFAQLKEVAGFEEITFDVPAGLQVEELATLLSEKIPSLEEFLKHGTQIALNCELTNAESRIQDGDEVALLPPFSGG